MKNIAIIRFENVLKSFGDNIILKNQTFDIMYGEIVGIIGPSGAGKSTLLNMIVGLLDIDKGNINYFHPDLDSSSSIYKKEKKIKELIGYSTQESSFYTQLTVYQNLVYFGTLLGIHKDVLKSQIDDLLKEFNLYEAKNVYASHLSVGMKKRLDLACSLIHSPRILILDEPTANLDLKLKEEILPYIKKINSMGVTVLYVTHNLEEIEKICDSVIMLNNGIVKVSHSPHNLNHKFKEFIKNG